MNAVADQIPGYSFRYRRRCRSLFHLTRSKWAPHTFGLFHSYTFRLWFSFGFSCHVRVEKLEQLIEMTATFVHIITLYREITILIIAHSGCRFIISWLICASRTLYLLTAMAQKKKTKVFNIAHAFECSRRTFLMCFSLFSLFFNSLSRFYYLTQWLLAVLFSLVDSKRTPAVHNCGFVQLQVVRPLRLIKILFAAHASVDFLFSN